LSTDPAKVVSFWEKALGWQRTFDEDDQMRIEPPKGSPEDGVAPDILFLMVPENRTLKNRLQLDITVSGGRANPSETRRRRVDAEAQRLEALGAALVRVICEDGVDH
jgi:hypothetical protein